MTSSTTGLLYGSGQLAKVAGQHAVRADRDRLLHRDVITTVSEAGFPRHFVPRRWGGVAGTFSDFLSAVTTVAQECASTAWVASLAAGVPRMAAYLPEDGQAELWQDGPDTFIVSGLMPSGRAVPVAGGWMLSGRWSFVSAVDFSDWALLCAHTEGTDPTPAALRYFAVPRRTYTIEQTWNSTGMRGTGSNTVIVENVYVPSARVCARDEVMYGRDDLESCCHRVPHVAINGLGFAAPVLGAARSMLSAWSAWAAERNSRTADGDPQHADNARRNEILAQAAVEIDTADLLLRRLAQFADDDVADTYLARTGRDAGFAAQLISTAAQRLWQSMGTSAQSAGSTQERAWRDINIGVTHLALRFDIAATVFARHELSQR